MSVEVVGPSGGEILQAGRLRIRILEDGSHTAHRLGLVEVTIPPGVSGPLPHIHWEHDETFFVVSGTATFTCGEERVSAGPGVLVTVAIGVPHSFANAGDDDAVLLNTVSPDRYIEYFRELARLPPGPPDPEAVARLMSRYGTEVVRPRAEVRRPRPAGRGA